VLKSEKEYSPHFPTQLRWKSASNQHVAKLPSKQHVRIPKGQSINLFIDAVNGQSYIGEAKHRKWL
jgi:hypothetical protein